MSVPGALPVVVVPVDSDPYDGSEPVVSAADTPVDAAPVSAVPAAVVAPAVTPASDETPQPLPTQPPAPIVVLSSCGGTGAADGSQRGASAPAAAVVGSALTFPVAENVAARTAPATGSVGITTADPATRPD
jgi:hypothetical protein